MGFALWDCQDFSIQPGSALQFVFLDTFLLDVMAIDRSRR
jgi:hypothetical protein